MRRNLQRSGAIRILVMIIVTFAAITINLQETLGQVVETANPVVRPDNDDRTLIGNHLPTSIPIKTTSPVPFSTATITQTPTATTTQTSSPVASPTEKITQAQTTTNLPTNTPSPMPSSTASITLAPTATDTPTATPTQTNTACFGLCHGMAFGRFGRQMGD